MTRVLSRLLLGVALTLACAQHALAGETLQRIIDFKTLKVGMSADQPPMTALNKQGGVMGFDVDLARALAKAMRVQLDIQVMPFGELFDALDKGEVDMVISNLSITPERTERAYFVGPYMMTGKSVLTRNSVLAEAKDSGALNRKDLKIAALKGSTSATYVKENLPDVQLIEVANSDDGVARLVAGEVDAMLADMATCKLAVLRNRDAGLVTLKEPLTIEPVGIAVSDDDSQFKNLVDNYLEAYARTGILAKMREKWFEQGDWVSALP